MPKIIISKEELEYLYLTKKLSMQKIADIKGIAVGTVFKKIHQYDIPTREQHKGMLNKKHSIETRQKLSLAHKNRKYSEETKVRMRLSKIGKYKKPTTYGGHNKIHQRGYIMIYKPEHPNATKEGYIFEHILVYENAVGEYVDRNKYVVHHINENKQDNRIENLQKMTKQEHMSYHMTKRHAERREQCKKYL